MGGIFSKAKQNDELAMKINYGDDADYDGATSSTVTLTPDLAIDYLSVISPDNSASTDSSNGTTADSIASSTKSIVDFFSTFSNSENPQTQIGQPPPNSTLALTKSKNDLDYQAIEIAFSLLVALLFLSFLIWWFVFQVQRIRLARARNSLIRQKSIKQIHVDHEINFVIVDFTDGTQKHFFG